MGWNVVNVEYRRASPQRRRRSRTAPCALRFLAAQAKTYNIDVTKIVVTGESAGG